MPASHEEERRESQQAATEIVNKTRVAEPEDSNPFTMQVADNPEVDQSRLKYGHEAMQTAGAQPEFIAANLLQAQSLNCAVILRAGDPPQYNKNRSPKSGVNLTKTSKQGFFKGSLSEELRFARFEDGKPRPHHYKDAAHLKLSIFNPDHQHTTQLDINIRDILREIGEKGDLEVLGYENGKLRFAYKDGKGPGTDTFNGQFVVDLEAGDDTPRFYSREWDRPENDPDWDPEKGVIQKPPELSMVPDEVYERVFDHTFKVGYTEAQQPDPPLIDTKPAKVFANRPRNVQDFFKAMDLDNPNSKVVQLLRSAFRNEEDLAPFIENLKSKKSMVSLFLELRREDGLGSKLAAEIIKETYEQGGSIIAGDWDGMALGHPTDIKPEYLHVYNTFAQGDEKIAEISGLHQATTNYLKEIQSGAREKLNSGEQLSAFESQALSIKQLNDVVSKFALERAGCITPHEFLFQQVLNAAYRDEASTHYGEGYNLDLVQEVMDLLILEGESVSEDEIKVILSEHLQAHGERSPDHMVERLARHLDNHLKIALKNEDSTYQLPHLDHDHNVHDLYQHGFDMRNPYGSNLEGEWLMVLPDGGVIHGRDQDDLIEVMLTGDFLRENLIDINHGAEMQVGWDRVVHRQLELGQSIPDKTYQKYEQYRMEQGLDVLAQVISLPKASATLVEGGADLGDMPVAVAENISVAEPVFDRSVYQDALMERVSGQEVRVESGFGMKHKMQHVLEQVQRDPSHRASSSRENTQEPSRHLSVDFNLEDKFSSMKHRLQQVLERVQRIPENRSPGMKN